MLTAIAEQMPTVLVDLAMHLSIPVPPEDNDTHRMLSLTALKIARIDEPIYFQEWYQEHDGHYWGHLDVVYHHDHDLRWAEIHEALRYDFLTGGLRWINRPSGWDGLVRLETQSFRVNFIPTVHR